MAYSALSCTKITVSGRLGWIGFRLAVAPEASPRSFAFHSRLAAADHLSLRMVYSVTSFCESEASSLGHKVEVTSFSSKNSRVEEQQSESTAPSPSRQRKRHSFLRSPGRLENVPSFSDFQQQLRVKSLYRQYFRLIYQSLSRDDTSRKEMMSQVRDEFRAQSRSATSPWDAKRAISEGTKRFKELSSMMGNSVVTEKPKTDDDGDENDGTSSRRTTTNVGLWPWQQKRQSSPQVSTKSPTSGGDELRPWTTPYPRKSGV